VKVAQSNSQQQEREEAIGRWSEFIRQQIGGPPERIAACVAAAIDALDTGKDVTAAIGKAAAVWDSTYQQPPSPSVPPAPVRRRIGLKLLLAVVVVLATAILFSALKIPGTAKREPLFLVIVLVIDIAATVSLIRLFRRF
jgi:hypothetical protein